jgi:hypothetical protein
MTIAFGAGGFFYVHRFSMDWWRGLKKMAGARRPPLSSR